MALMREREMGHSSGQEEKAWVDLGRVGRDECDQAMLHRVLKGQIKI